eukprot:354955-Chlamydomonas_euryale.AAC.2
MPPLFLGDDRHGVVAFAVPPDTLKAPRIDVKGKPADSTVPHMCTAHAVRMRAAQVHPRPLMWRWNRIQGMQNDYFQVRVTEPDSSQQGLNLP